MVRTPSGYVQQNPWLGVANRQLELMNRFAAEMGLTPSARSRVEALRPGPIDVRNAIEIVVVPAPARTTPVRPPEHMAGPPRLPRAAIVEVAADDAGL